MLYLFCWDLKKRSIPLLGVQYNLGYIAHVPFLTSVLMEDIAQIIGQKAKTEEKRKTQFDNFDKGSKND